MKGGAEASTWPTVEKIALGLERIDLLAKTAFMRALELPDDAFLELEGHDSWVAREEQPEAISMTMSALDDLGLLDQEAVQQLRKQLHGMKGISLTLEEWVSLKMQEKRRSEDKAD